MRKPRIKSETERKEKEKLRDERVRKREKIKKQRSSETRRERETERKVKCVKFSLCIYVKWETATNKGARGAVGGEFASIKGTHNLLTSGRTP